MTGGKAEKGTSKYLAIRMKSKGLQKLKFFCQVCNKQCRDENGFKCHILSETHNRQIQLIADNPAKYENQFSHDFERAFMDLMRTCYSSKTVSANRVYKDYISDRNHVHMNATRWATLTAFCNHLAKKGLILIEGPDDNNSVLIKYVDVSPDAVSSRSKENKREKMEEDEQNEEKKLISQQMKMANSVAREQTFDIKPLEKTGNEKITLKMSKNDVDAKSGQLKDYTSPFGEPKAKSGSKLLHVSEKSKVDESDSWIAVNIVVKIITQKIGQDLYKKKCKIIKIDENIKNTAICQLIEDPTKTIRIHQDFLETVIPALGSQILVVNGKYKNCIATVVTSDEERGGCAIEILSDERGRNYRKFIEFIDYESICKYVG